MSAQREQTLDYSWLHDDMEEDLVGADWHQDAIRALSFALQGIAEERHLPWHIGDQLTLMTEKPDGKEWRPAPDISIHPTLGSGRRDHIDVREEGPPTLVVEVASASTWAYDVSLESSRRGKRQAGKAFGYLVLMHVPEYLVFDPRGEFIAGGVRAWHRAGDMVEAWHPDADGRYHSQELGISFRPDGALLRVFDHDGRPVPYLFETMRENAALRQERVAQAQRITELEAELERLRQRE